MEKINIAELLKDCPKGMELDCVLFNNPVTLDKMSGVNNIVYPIAVTTVDGHIELFNKYGHYLNRKDTKCVIFPKGKTTWEGFHRPFENGDIIYTKHKLGTEFVSIFQIEYERDICTYWDINLSTNKLIGNLHEGNAFKVFIEKDKVKEQRLATEEEKEKLFKVIKDNGYKWNTETKTLEKLPKFKIGDKVRHKNNHSVVFTITSIKEDTYICGAAKAFWFEDQDKYELVPNKFDITTLKPFDKVLARDKNTEEWRAHFFSHYRDTSDRPYICIGTEGINEYRQCIPFEGNEHLLGKTEDCIDFYKTWTNEEK